MIIFMELPNRQFIQQLAALVQASDGVDHKALESALLDNPAGNF